MFRKLPESRSIKYRKNSELYGSVITLKNLSSVMRDNSFSADYIFEMLRENTRVLRPAYDELILAFRNGSGQEAFITFGERTGTRAGKAFAAILSYMDRMSPDQLSKQIEVLQSSMAEEQMTDASKRAQRNSIIISVWAAATVFALLINFAVTAVFLDALATLSHLF